MSTACLPFELPAHSPQHPPLSSAEDGIQGEGFSHFGNRLSFPRSPPDIHGIKILCAFFLSSVN